jgi:hypothetical protein
MRIRLDDMDVALEDSIIAAGKEAVFSEIKRIALEGSGVIVEIIVDGETVPDEEAFFSLAGGYDIRFISQPIKDLVRESIEEGDRYLPLLKDGLEAVATLFERGDYHEAQSRLSQGVEGIDWLSSVLGKCCILRGIALSDFKSGNYEEYTAELNKTLNELISSLESGKNLQIAYIIRENLSQLINRFSDFWDEIKEQIDTPLH